MTPADFRQLLKNNDPEAVLEQYIFTEKAVHVSDQVLSEITAHIATSFATEIEGVQTHVVGSAKLGFSIVEKRTSGVVMPRYREFSPDSDIDIAVVAPAIFDKIWEELSQYSHSVIHRPWKSGRLGDYLVCGWLRPDHFPKATRLRHCDAWRDCFNGLSARSMARRKIRGGLFHSKEHMRQYYMHAVRECFAVEEIQQ